MGWTEKVRQGVNGWSTSYVLRHRKERSIIPAMADYEIGDRRPYHIRIRAGYIPRGSIYTIIIIMELGPKRPSPLWFRRPNSIIVVYMDPLGFCLEIMSMSFVSTPCLGTGPLQ